MTVRFLTFSVAFLAASTAAHAGGFTAPTTEAPPIVTAPVANPANWEGGYVGGTLGYAFGGDDKVGIGMGQVRTLTTPGTLELNGANAGLRAGYRWERPVREKSIVFGLELGIEGGNVSDKFDTAGYKSTVDVNHVIALRAKTGMPVGADNNTLAYGIAGVAQGDFNYTVKGDGAGGPANIDTSFSKTGYIVGLGVERRVRDNLSVTGEWEYANFGKKDLSDAANKTTKATPDYHNLKLGVNYQF